MVAVRLDGAGDLADIVRTLDGEGLKVENLRLHAPSLDDVFLAKTGRSLEGAQEEAEREAEPVEAE
jgi:ABC-2 type transport system ATP-binding protein